MISALIYILIVVLIGAVIAGIIQYAPFIPPPFKQYAIYVVGAVIIILIILALVPLLQGAANLATAPVN